MDVVKAPSIPSLIIQRSGKKYAYVMVYKNKWIDGRCRRVESHKGADPSLKSYEDSGLRTKKRSFLPRTPLSKKRKKQWQGDHKFVSTSLNGCILSYAEAEIFSPPLYVRDLKSLTLDF